mmetsp:Transcript_1797/g.3381  ORF Transcript_1797/g.3381 Transcript_1797/m.3381 type:complete len:469 (-) Transcript_1797:79-1485(-)
MSSQRRRRGCGEIIIATSSHCCNDVATILRKSIIATLSLLALCPTAIHSLAFDTQSLSARSSCSFTSSSSTNPPFIFNNNNNNNCQGPPSPASSSSSSNLQMKVSSTSSKRTRSSKSSHLIERNNLRLRSAGKPGSKHFMDPNKLFIGNLPYAASESDVIDLFAKEWNIPPEAVTDRIESIKIIRDWKTNQSKGYGFVQFYEPMMATSAMESVNKGANWNGKNRGAWKIMGRKIRLDQGQRKPDDEDAAEKLLKKKKQKKEKEESKMQKEDLDEEGLLIHSVLEGVEGDSSSGASVSSRSGSDASSSVATQEEEEEDYDDGLGMSEDDMITFMEKGGLRGVMPLTEETAGFLGIEGLYEDDEGFDEVDESYFEEYYNLNGYSDGDFDDASLDSRNEDGAEDDGEDGEDDDDDEIVYDGVFEEMYNPNEYESLSEEEEEAIQKMNREQRRAAEKKRKKRKLPFKGFGSR